MTDHPQEYEEEFAEEGDEEEKEEEYVPVDPFKVDWSNADTDGPEMAALETLAAEHIRMLMKQGVEDAEVETVNWLDQQGIPSHLAEMCISGALAMMPWTWPDPPEPST